MGPTEEFTRRRYLGLLGGGLGLLSHPEVLSALQHAKHAVSTGSTKFEYFDRETASDMEALTAQIIPTDDTPGAREAGVALFIDRALATFFGRMAPDFRSQLAAFRLRCQAQHPDAGSFAALSNEQQIAFLKQVDRTPFFERVRLLTLVGMFAMPKYGGNRDGIGWKLLGFQDQHIFTPPFGYYDRDYPGFKIEVVSKS